MKQPVAAFKRTISDAIAALLFGPLAPCYDGWTWAISLGRWRSWQLTALEYIVGPRVLEIGCGPGHLIAAVAQGGSQCCGADESRQMLALARANVQQRGVCAHLVRCVGQELPFRDGSFDTVVLCFSGLAWIPEVLVEARRTMAPAGSLVVVDEVLFPRSTRASRIIRWALTLYDCEQDSAPHDIPLRYAGFLPRVEERQVGDSVVRFLVAQKAPVAARSTP